MPPTLCAPESRPSLVGLVAGSSPRGCPQLCEDRAITLGNSSVGYSRELPPGTYSNLFNTYFPGAGMCKHCAWAVLMVLAFQWGNRLSSWRMLVVDHMPLGSLLLFVYMHSSGSVCVAANGWPASATFFSCLPQVV